MQAGFTTVPSVAAGKSYRLKGRGRMEEEVLRKLMGQLMPKVTTQLRSAMANMHFASAALAPEDQRTADPELDRKAAYLDQSYYQLLRLVNNLALADLLTSQRELPLRDRDLADLVREACLRAESLAALKGLELEFRCPRESHVCAFDRDTMEQLLFQLLSNAFKFTPAGGKITVKLDFTPGTVLLSVSDTGEGIPPEKLEALFAPQPETDAASALPPHGVGVGLLLCHQIARAHSGRVMAAPRPGGGTTVTFSMPDRKTGFTAVDDVPFDYAGGFDRTLLCLADALPVGAFTVAER